MPEESRTPRPSDPRVEETRKDREIARLREEVARLERAKRQLERENERLKRELAAAQRAAKRQAAPFSKGAPVAAPQRTGRRPGRHYGRHGYRRAPTQIDEVCEARLPAACPHCGGRVSGTHVAIQIQEELPIVRPHVRRFRVHVGQCRACRRRVQGRHPLQTSEALGAASTHLGPQAVALIVLLNKQLGVSHGKIATLLHDWFDLSVRPSGVTHTLHRAARQAAPTYATLREQIRGSPVVTPDETGWKINGVGQWLWAFATPSTVVYRIAPGRGSADAADVLGANFAGVLVRDGWLAYRQFTQARHQSCLAHLVRRCQDLLVVTPQARFPARVKRLLQGVVALRARHATGAISVRGLASARGQLFFRLVRVLGTAGRSITMQRFAAHLSHELPAIFECLFDPTVDATNWRAEQALRPAVVNRKVSGGNRSARGANTQQILTSVVQTARLRRLEPRRILVDLLHARQPTVSAALAAQPQ